MYWTYEEAKKYVNENMPNIKTKAQYVKDRQKWTEGYLPKRPNKVYADCGWVSWNEFLNYKV
jgi:hypothetical protein